MLHNLRPAVAMLLAFTLLTGVVYPLAITGIGWIDDARSGAWAASSIKDGKVVGSSLVGQSFTERQLFPCRARRRPRARSGR